MSSPCPKEAGFTLLEIMLSVLILGLVVSMVTVALSGSINAIDVTMKQGQLYYRAQIAMERISEDLTSALLTSDMEFIGEAGSGDQSTLLSFSSMAHLVLNSRNNESGLARISYVVQADNNHDGHLLLLRSDVLQRPTEDGKNTGEVEAFILADQLRAVTFTFLDNSGEEQASWDTTVQSDDDEAKAERRLPAAVTCRLEFWVNEEEEQTLFFQTTVLLPTGLIQEKPKGN
ncbi:MAG: type II secretion system protein [Candidatus Electrothrix sp.]